MYFFFIIELFRKAVNCFHHNFKPDFQMLKLKTLICLMHCINLIQKQTAESNAVVHSS